MIGRYPRRVEAVQPEVGRSRRSGLEVQAFRALCEPGFMPPTPRSRTGTSRTPAAPRSRAASTRVSRRSEIHAPAAIHSGKIVRRVAVERLERLRRRRGCTCTRATRRRHTRRRRAAVAGTRRRARGRRSRARPAADVLGPRRERAAERRLVDRPGVERAQPSAGGPHVRRRSSRSSRSCSADAGRPPPGRTGPAARNRWSPDREKASERRGHEQRPCEPATRDVDAPSET